MPSSYKSARPGGNKTNTSTLVTQFQTLNVMDIPQYDNGNSHTDTSYSKKGLKAFPTITSSPYSLKVSRQHSTNIDNSNIVTKRVQPHAPQIQTSTTTAKHKSQKVSYGFTDEELVPKSLQPRGGEEKVKLTRRAQALGYSAAPDAHKYMNRPLPALPNTKTKPTPAAVISRKENKSTKPQPVYPASTNNNQTAKLSPPKKYQAGIEIVDYHLTQGKVTKYNPNRYDTKIDRQERAQTAAALSTYDKDVSKTRLDRARHILRGYTPGRIGLHRTGPWVECREWRALNSKERSIIEREIAAGWFDGFNSAPTSSAFDSVLSTRRDKKKESSSTSRCVIM